MPIHIILLMVCSVATTDAWVPGKQWVPKTTKTSMATATTQTARTQAPAISDDDLKYVSSLLWENATKYSHFFKKDIDYAVHDPWIQGKKLFEKMKLNEALLQTGTWPTFIELLDNYNPVTGVPELKSKQEILEEDQFINAILRTEVMEELWKTLKNANLITGTIANEFKVKLSQLWFHIYSRFPNGHLDSSGFEHVFVGEINLAQPAQNKKKARNAYVSGLHNWMQFYLEEKHGRLTVSGLGKTCEPTTKELEFTWRGVDKIHPWSNKNNPSTVLFGVTPEFEMALYTLCFMARPHQMCMVNYGGFDRNITTRVKRMGTVEHVATAYTTCLT